jgi:transcriptional regulator with GAF, ATPase, and Fis domain
MLRRAVWLLFCAFVALAGFTLARTSSFVGQPFPGFLMYPNGMVSLFRSDLWPGTRFGIETWDVIREVDGRPVADAGEVLAIVRQKPPQTFFVYTVRREGRTLKIAVPSMRFGENDFVYEILPFIVTGVAFALAGLWIYRARPGRANFGFAVFGLAIGAALLRIDFFITGWGAYPLQFMLPLVAAALVHLGLVFPRRPAIVRRRPGILLAPYAVSMILGVLRAVFVFRAPEVWVRLDQTGFAYAAGACVFLVGTFAYGALRAPDQVARERARVVLWGLVPAVLSAAGGFGLRWLTGSQAAISFVPLLAAWLWIGSLAYAAVKRNIFDFEIFARRTVTYTILWVLTVVAYAVALTVARFLLGRIGYSARASLPLTALFVAVPLIPGFVSALQRRVETRLFPLHVRVIEVVGRLSEKLSQLMEASDVARKLRETFLGEVGLAAAVLYVAGDRGFIAVGDADAPRPIDAVEQLRGRFQAGETMSIFDLRERGDRAVAAWMTEHRLAILLPLVARGRLEGVLALGDAPGGHVFDSEEIDALAAFASRLAISLANARAYERIQDLEARTREENQALREELELHPGFPEIIGRSPRILAVFRAIEQVANADTTVLLLGETGTGKELVARALHVRSARRDGPLVKVNCAAIPRGLIESELFGHERGAFTDATTRRRGRFEVAEGGTILLDEIGELPLEVQAKLLRIVQEREFERVGGRETLRADVRVLAATNRDLRAEVVRGRFREDLFFRLNVFPIVLPPLRDRPEDVAPLVRHFVARLNAKFDKHVLDLTPESWSHLERYRWPGNVRELENVIERAMVLCEGSVLSVPRLDQSEPQAPVDVVGDERPRSLAEVLRETKIAAIDRALAEAGSQAKAAKLLGLKAPSLSRMLRELGMRT